MSDENEIDRLRAEVSRLQKRIDELEAALEPFAEMGPAFVEGETLKGQILVILQRDDVEKARAARAYLAAIGGDER